MATATRTIPTASVLSGETPATPVALTGRQKVALMLEKAGYSHSAIARKLNIRHRQAASRLIARAKAAEKAFFAAAADFVACN